MALTGVWFALSAAAFWAIATRLFKSMADYWSAASLALIKSLLSLVFFGGWFFLAGTPLLEQEVATILWLLLSGVIGIAIGDTALFLALYKMGERTTLLIAETAAPILVLAGAFVFLKEHITWLQFAGVVLVIFGVDWVIGLRRGGRLFDVSGLGWAMLAALCQAFGVLVSRLFLTATDISAEETAFWRIAGACLVLPGWLIWRGETLRPAKVLTPRVVGRLLAGIVLGTILGILFLQISISRLPAGLAQTLIATSILFAVLFAALLGEKVSPRQWGGVLIAFAGVGLLSLQLMTP